MNLTYSESNNPDWNGIEYMVPDHVTCFEPSNGVPCLLSRIRFGKNVKSINTYIDKQEDGIEPNPEVVPDVVICGYKGSAAEKWAEEQYAKFEEIKEVLVIVKHKSPADFIGSAGSSVCGI